MMIHEKLQSEFSLTKEHTDNIIALLDDGNTVPFIARYRKEMTGHIDDQVLRSFLDRLTYLRNLEKRKEEVKKSITEQGKITDEILSSLEVAETLTEVEDIYRPFKQKKKTRATVAIAKGLSPLADIFLAQDGKGALPNEVAVDYINDELGVASVEDAINGAKDIIAERSQQAMKDLEKEYNNKLSQNALSDLNKFDSLIINNMLFTVVEPFFIVITLVAPLWLATVIVDP